MNFSAVEMKFGELQIGASFVYRQIAFYKIATDTAISTTTGVQYLIMPTTVVSEIVFPEIGETFSGCTVVSGVIGGSVDYNSNPIFYYKISGSLDSGFSFATFRGTYWQDNGGNNIHSFRSVVKEVVCR